MNKKKRVVVVGATGHFGGRLCRRLLNESDLEIVITSRSIKSATAFTLELKRLDPKADILASKIDFDDKSFEADLQALHPDIVVHTAGPFQGQDYRVAKACIRCGSHYLDLADGREFTHGFKILNDAAVENGVLLVTGASTLPGLSTAVIDELRPHLGDEFPLLDEPGDRALVGASFGAVASLHTAWSRPGTFGKLLLQSGSFAFTDVGDHEMGPSFDTVVEFVNEFRKDPGRPADQIFLSAGIYESLIYFNRSLLPVLQGTGAEVRLVEAQDGHNWEIWLDRFRDGLTWLFPGPLWMFYE